MRVLLDVIPSESTFGVQSPMVLALEHRTNTVSSLVVPLPMVGAWTGSTRRITGTVSSCDPGGREFLERECCCLAMSGVYDSKVGHSRLVVVDTICNPASCPGKASKEGATAVQCSTYHTYGTFDLAVACLSALGDNYACFLANHGAVVVGIDLEHAMYLAERLERGRTPMRNFLESQAVVSSHHPLDTWGSHEPCSP
jgi:hypothetical protein